ncbi:cell division transmembrane ftsK domain protein [Mycobacterium ulcerans str. Harvey]|uniref:Cell division transmembrane ftsK domain protein n=1 Tax=Mycobacterium ulcerans str. Harvey TaxID=1299332 RepID=A0ABN0QTT2_MYCUL|nr:cell division transmembrane ftsK domain protein [Mycobacterium ulcerans str. Harvey]
MFAGRGEHLGHRGRGAMGGQCLRVGPLFDENEGFARLMQRVELAAGFAVHLFDRRGEDVADGVDRLRLDGQRGDDDDGHAGTSWGDCGGFLVV